MKNINITYNLETMLLSPAQTLNIQKALHWALHDDVNLTPDMKAVVNVPIGGGSLTRKSNKEERA